MNFILFFFENFIYESCTEGEERTSHRMVLTLLVILLGRNEMWSAPYTVHKNQFQMEQGLKCESQLILGENIGTFLYEVKVEKDFLNKTLKNAHINGKKGAINLTTTEFRSVHQV